MPNISSRGNIPAIKRGYKKLLGLGEGIAADEFIMTFDGNSDIRYLVQSTQLPAVQRENIESFGPHGVYFNQMGRYKNAQDITITFKETINGHAMAFLRDLVVNRKYFNCKLTLAGEGFSENGKDSVILEDCWFEMDSGVDLSVDDATSLVKPSATLHANWIAYENTSSTGLGLL